MPFLSTPLTLSATGGILGSAWVSGSLASLSICAIPALLQCGTTTEGLLRGWHLQYSRGLAHIPTTAAVIGLNYIYLAYHHHSLGLEWRGYATAAFTNLMMAPYTFAIIGATNNKLLGALSGTGKPLTESVVRMLMEKWSKLSAVRVLMPLAGAILGLWNLLQ
ncbi:hypothetical protein F4821DRAFT_235817 [Hypoxylon rubiginosum]|uniref:Uncharacterized protein n=1 Tax=Hypoxylon rubiginosum TaxID=110542 RepID=A0ACC0D4V9_9PEZI|nr:hypothetical protein F4821DRAFT_235817 [Hypoxylon rubiginosum]